MKTIVKIYDSIIVYALCFLLLSCAAPQEDSSMISEGISNTNSKFMSAVSDGDAARVVAQYTEDAQVLPPNADFASGKQEIQNLFQGFIDSGVKGMNLESIEIEGMGDTAFEIGKYTILGEGDQVLDNGKYIVIWKKVGEEWKLHRDIFNSNMPLPMNDDDDDEDEDSDDEDEGEESDE